ncbi:MAG TPA: DUF5677 domain-containing protein [Terriglobia bacterium]|nr:DUF5677 domain-containing protein [Terriglobia bacterium]
MSPAEHQHVTFGFEDFWPAAREQYERQFDAIADLMGLGNEMLQAAENKAAERVQKVIYELTRATVAGASDVILLCGNGCGPGAMKIVRGVYESRWMAEYLRRNPKEVEDYINFGPVQRWRTYQWLRDNIPDQVKHSSPEAVKNIEDEYNEVKAQFTNSKGRERFLWSTKSIGKMAEEIGCGKEFRLPYSMACSIHHANAEGLLAAARVTPPSLEWVGAALVTAHTNLWFVLSTLNDSCNLGFSDKLTAAQESHSRVWKE